MVMFATIRETRQLVLPLQTVLDAVAVDAVYGSLSRGEVIRPSSWKATFRPACRSFAVRWTRAASSAPLRNRRLEPRIINFCVEAHPASSPARKRSRSRKTVRVLEREHGQRRQEHNWNDLRGRPSIAKGMSVCARASTPVAGEVCEMGDIVLEKGTDLQVRPLLHRNEEVHSHTGFAVRRTPSPQHHTKTPKNRTAPFSYLTTKEYPDTGATVSAAICPDVIVRPLCECSGRCPTHVSTRAPCQHAARGASEMNTAAASGDWRGREAMNTAGPANIHDSRARRRSSRRNAS